VTKFLLTVLSGKILPFFRVFCYVFDTGKSFYEKGRVYKMYAIYAGEQVEGEPQLDYINSFENEKDAIAAAEELKATYGQIGVINEASKELIWNHSLDEEPKDEAAPIDSTDEE
jgi:hypothetical protein